jgi:hypothetical protein
MPSLAAHRAATIGEDPRRSRPLLAAAHRDCSARGRPVSIAHAPTPPTILLTTTHEPVPKPDHPPEANSASIAGRHQAPMTDTDTTRSLATVRQRLDRLGVRL